MTDTDHIPVEHLPHYRDLVTRLPHTESELRTAITMAVGEASSCWQNLDGAGVFDDERAAQVAHQLIERVLDLTKLGEPSLGCATNRELRAELIARAELGNVSPDYRSVEG